MYITDDIEFNTKIEKLCKLHLIRIRSLATSMVSIEALINEAKIDFFGFRDIGILKSQMIRDGKEIEFMHWKLTEKDICWKIMRNS